MQSLVDTNINSATSALYEQPARSYAGVNSTTAILVTAAVASAFAIELVKVFGFANGMPEHTRMILSYVGLGICFVSAPSFLIFGKHLRLRTGLFLGGSLVFTVTLLASLVA